MNNPLLSPAPSPFGIPPFQKIENAHFMPAIKAGIEAQQAEIAAILSQPEKPNFDNTVRALEQSGRLLGYVNTLFANLNSAHTSDAMQALAREISPKLSAHYDNIALDEKLFERLKAVHDMRHDLHLNAEDLRLLEKHYKSFARNGALLDGPGKQQLRDINARLSLLSLQFSENVLAETNDFQLHVKDASDLSGLPEWLMESGAASAKAAGKDGYLFILHAPSVLPFLQYADNRALRKDIWEAYRMRGNNGNTYDNKDIIKEMTSLRIQRAQLLGYPNHAAYVLEESMAGSVKGVESLLDQLLEPTLKAAQREADDLQALIREEGQTFALAPYDWRYYAAKLRAARFDLNEEELKPYLKLEDVREGVFMVCEKLYGLQFEQIDDAALYHPEAEAYEVRESDGSHIGVLLMDMHARSSKRGGAWMTSYRRQERMDGKRIAPIISIVCNFPPLQAGQPVLLTFEEVTTFFHEFGHALHGLLSDVSYRSLSGTSVYRDFVELPSQVLENWATAPEVIKQYARHHETGAPMPDALIEKIRLSGSYGEGFATAEYLASTYLDLAYHTLEAPFTESVNDFEGAEVKRIGMPESIIPRHRSTYFSHIFAGGYSAGYYSYIWSAVLDSDAFEAFVETGDLFDPGTASRFRKYVLSTGGTADPAGLYRKFRGADPEIGPLLKKRGLVAEAAAQ